MKHFGERKIKKRSIKLYNGYTSQWMRNIYVTICYKYNENVISIQGTGSMALYFVYSFEIEQTVIYICIYE